MAVKIFISYAHEDEVFMQQLKIHLRLLQHQGLIEMWYDRDINAGTEWQRHISKELDDAQIILILVSPDFLNSDYCYTVEMRRALERHENGEALVIPVILRPVYWEKTPFGKLQALPKGGEPVVSRSWHDVDNAFYEVAEGIYQAVMSLNISKSFSPSNASKEAISEEEELSRAAIITKLRKLYVLSHDNISPGIMAGTEPLPEEWVNEQLEQMGETWRPDIYFEVVDIQKLLLKAQEPLDTVSKLFKVGKGIKQDQCDKAISYINDLHAPLLKVHALYDKTSYFQRVFPIPSYQLKVMLNDIDDQIDELISNLCVFRERCSVLWVVTQEYQSDNERKKISEQLDTLLEALKEINTILYKFLQSQPAI